MTREDLINQRATTCRHGGHCEWVACDKCNHYEPSPLSQQPCDDCISRQAVLKLLSYDWAYRPAQKAVESIKNLPSITPKEKTGHWINNHTQCSKCEWGMEDDVVGSPMVLFFPYCPNCGARMVEPQEIEVSE